MSPNVALSFGVVSLFVAANKSEVFKTTVGFHLSLLARLCDVLQRRRLLKGVVMERKFQPLHNQTACHHTQSLSTKSHKQADLMNSARSFTMGTLSLSPSNNSLGQPTQDPFSRCQSGKALRPKQHERFAPDVLVSTFASFHLSFITPSFAARRTARSRRTRRLSGRRFGKLPTLADRQREEHPQKRSRSSLTRRAGWRLLEIVVEFATFAAVSVGVVEQRRLAVPLLCCERIETVAQSQCRR